MKAKNKKSNLVMLRVLVSPDYYEYLQERCRSEDRKLSQLARHILYQEKITFSKEY